MYAYISTVNIKVVHIYSTPLFNKVGYRYDISGISGKFRNGVSLENTTSHSPYENVGGCVPPEKGAIIAPYDSSFRYLRYKRYMYVGEIVGREHGKDDDASCFLHVFGGAHGTKGHNQE